MSRGIFVKMLGVAVGVAGFSLPQNMVVGNRLLVVGLDPLSSLPQPALLTAALPQDVGGGGASSGQVCICGEFDRRW